MVAKDVFFAKTRLLQKSWKVDWNQRFDLITT